MDTQRKKILYVITKSNWGGAQRYVYDLAVSLSRQHDVIVALGGDGILAQRLRDKNIRVISLPSLARDISIFGDIKAFFGLAHMFFKEKPDLVHVNSSKVGGLGALAARIARVPRIVFTSHGWAWNEERGFLASSLIRLASWATVVLAHATITVSTRDTIEGTALPFVGGRVRMVHNGVGALDFLPRNEARRFLIDRAHAVGVKITDNEHLFGTIGELHANKGYAHTLEALKIAKATIKKPFTFCILGGGEEQKNLETLAGELGLRDIVSFLGFVPDASRYLSGFDTFCFSSVKEGLPYVILEAGSAALPVISTNVGGIADIVTDMKTGILVQPKKSQEMAQAMDFMISNPDRARGFGTALRDTIQDGFSLEAMVAATLKTYKL